MSEAELICDLPRLEELFAGWDALAVTNAAPESSPAWMIGWWRHVAPQDAQLRVVAVHDSGQLIGIAPLYVETGQPRLGRSYRLLANDFSGYTTPLALPDRTWEVAEMVTRTLVEAEPRPSALELGPLPAISPWVTALRERWPGRVRPFVYRTELLEVPTVSLHQESFDAWLQARGSRFRRNCRRYRRRFEQEGGTERFSTAATVSEDIETFARLHAARWHGLGVSRLAALGDRLPLLLGDLAQTLLPQERLRLLMLEIDGEPICADLCIAAGGEVIGVNVGWDERFKHLSAPRLSMLSMIEQGFHHGDRRFSLGWGRVDYKRAFANGGDVATWDVLLPAGAQLPLALVRAAPTIASRRIRQSAKRLLPAEGIERLRVVRERTSGAQRVTAPTQ
jgi:CelD/BcsL family acetyltransferase involved in cellulose biosynthesis